MLNQIDVIGNWLFHGGRVRILKQIITNGGVVFDEGEVLRLRNLEPYGGGSKLAGMYFESEADPTKSLYHGGALFSTSGDFEVLF